MILDIVGLQISVPEFILTIISFFLFMFLLNKFLFKPVLSFMDARKARIDEGLAEGKKAETALEENKAQLAQELAQTGAEARGVINAARSDAEKAKGEVLTLFVNGTPVLEASDSRYAYGMPGLGLTAAGETLWRALHISGEC